MTLLDAVLATGPLPPGTAPQAQKKRFSEVLSSHLAQEIADGLRGVGFTTTKPARGGPGERAFQGGLGPKKVDVSYSDDQHGLHLAVSIKTICFPPYGKNLKNRLGDLLTEAITLHLRFPYSVVCSFFAFPSSADMDTSEFRKTSTFHRATGLMGIVAGRADYTDPGEKFEIATMLLFHPVAAEGAPPWIRLYDAVLGEEQTEADYFLHLREAFRTRNPHMVVGETNGEEDNEGGAEE